jgi:hypothetical protein
MSTCHPVFGVAVFRRVRRVPLASRSTENATWRDRTLALPSEMVLNNCFPGGTRLRVFTVTLASRSYPQPRDTCAWAHHTLALCDST